MRPGDERPTGGRRSAAERDTISRETSTGASTENGSRRGPCEIEEDARNSEKEPWDGKAPRKAERLQESSGADGGTERFTAVDARAKIGSEKEERERL